MRTRKNLVLITASIAFCLILSIFIFRPPTETLNMVSYPVFGRPEAPFEIVVFEDFRCAGCRKLMEDVLPEIKSKYLANGKARIKIIPVGFLNGSKPLANAALEVYAQAPDRFFDYTKGLFEGREWLELAKEVGEINLDTLQTCMEKKCHYKEIESNLVEAKLRMGKKFRIPALFINGVRVEHPTFETIEREMGE